MSRRAPQPEKEITMPMMWDGATEMGDDQAIHTLEKGERALHDLAEAVKYALRARAESAALEKDTAAREGRAKVNAGLDSETAAKRAEVAQLDARLEAIRQQVEALTTGR